jgi:uncharacterized protein (TIGR03086 family)
MLLPVNEIAERFRRRAAAFEALIADAAADRWASPSPCEGWTARDVVAHIVGFPTWDIPSSVSERLRVETVDDDPLGGFRLFRDAVQRVLDDPSTPADVAEYIDQALSFDLAQHWWDLARATGQDATMDPDEVDVLWTTLSSMPPNWWKWQVEQGYYAPAVTVPEDAPLQDRVLGLIGRDPGWTPPA